MSQILISDVIDAINQFAPLSLQEEWDNSGVQVGVVNTACTGVLICVDVTPDIVGEARARGCNLIVSHHPLIFRGLKQIVPDNSLVQKSVYEAIGSGIAVYSGHTSLDSAPMGVSYRIAEMLGAKFLAPLSPSGLGCVAEFDSEISKEDFVARVKETFGSPVVRCSSCARAKISRVALCGGSGGEFIRDAIENDCSAFLTSDVRYHDFVDYGNRILIADIGHFESEECSKQIFYDIISKKFPKFAVYKSETERNPINYE